MFDFSLRFCRPFTDSTRDQGALGDLHAVFVLVDGGSELHAPYCSNDLDCLRRDSSVDKVGVGGKQAGLSEQRIANDTHATESLNLVAVGLR